MHQLDGHVGVVSGYDQDLRLMIEIFTEGRRYKIQQLPGPPLRETMQQRLGATVGGK